MRRGPVRAATAAIAALVVVVLVVDGIYAINHPWYVKFEYARGGYPQDRYGLTRPERTRLALVGLRSIQPWHDGEATLGRARLPDGSPAFDVREIRHMGDVRTIVTVLLATHAVVALLLAALVARRRTRTFAIRGLTAGALLTLVVAALVGIFLLVSPVGFLDQFHGVFFAGDSWRFQEHDTLRRLYPDRFWSDTAAVLGALVVVQALVVLTTVFFYRRSSRRRPPRELKSRAEASL